MGADCKSVGLCLRRFESYICHPQNPGERTLAGVLSFVDENWALPVGASSSASLRRNGRVRQLGEVADQQIWFWNRLLCNLVKASTRSDVRAEHAPLAQSVERFHGKEKVNGSIPLGGSLD